MDDGKLLVLMFPVFKNVFFVINLNYLLCSFMVNNSFIQFPQN